MSDQGLDFEDMFGGKSGGDQQPIDLCATTEASYMRNDNVSNAQKCDDNNSSNQSVGSSSSDDYRDMFGDSSSDSDESNKNLAKGVYESSSLHSSSNIRVPRKQKRRQGDIIPMKNLSTEDNLKRKRDTRMISHANSEIISYKSYSIEDYWRSFRSWDFVSELNQNMQRNISFNKLRQGEDLDEEASGSCHLKKAGNSHEYSRGVAQSPGHSEEDDVVPDEFKSVEQYIALWAPLQLKETKAQVLSDVISNHNVSFQKISLPIHVKPKKTAETYSESMTLIISLRSEDAISDMVRGQNNGQALEFLQNDLVLVSCDASIAEQAYKGTLRPTESQSSYSMSTLLSMASPFASGRLAIVGVVCNRSKGVDGLEVTVKRNLWKDTSLSGRDLFLMKLGKNVTCKCISVICYILYAEYLDSQHFLFLSAFREFKALCSIKEMPLSAFIMSPKQKVDSPLRKKSVNAIQSDPLSESGGSNALGIGFRIWIKSKFNQSQQAAISAAAREYGDGGFTLVQGPPGSGKSTTLVAILNALHLRQYQKYYSSIERITLSAKTSNSTEVLAAIKAAGDVKPRILVCAPSNAAVDNIILKIMESRFYDGNGCQYSPSIIRIGSGQSPDVVSVALDQKVNKIISLGSNPGQLDKIIVDTRKELKRLQNEIENLQIRVRVSEVHISRLQLPLESFIANCRNFFNPFFYKLAHS
jgi:Predicted ATP-dependent serine protease